MRWNLVMCGSRSETCERFLGEMSSSLDEFPVLLVDSDAEVNKAPKAHLAEMTGSAWAWDQALEEQVHLMVQTMETWLVADVEALRAYYGRHFKSNVLPKRQDLEKLPKENVGSALARASRRTQKGEYHKIDHASELLSRVDPEKVRRRCRHCKRLFDTLTSVIENA